MRRLVLPAQIMLVFQVCFRPDSHEVINMDDYVHVLLRVEVDARRGLYSTVANTLHGVSHFFLPLDWGITRAVHGLVELAYGPPPLDRGSSAGSSMNTFRFIVAFKNAFLMSINRIRQVPDP